MFLPSLLHLLARSNFLVRTFPRSSSSPLCLVKTSTSTGIILVPPSPRFGHVTLPRVLIRRHDFQLKNFITSQDIGSFVTISTWSKVLGTVITLTEVRGELPLALGSYSTLQKSKRDKEIDHTEYRYLDKVHVDIGFGDTFVVGAPDTASYLWITQPVITGCLH